MQALARRASAERSQTGSVSDVSAAPRARIRDSGSSGLSGSPGADQSDLAAEGETQYFEIEGEVHTARSPSEVYCCSVAERMARPKGLTSKTDRGSDGLSLKDHVVSVFEACGLDPARRMSEVQHAVQRQQELQAEKKQRKKDRMRDAVRGANKKLTLHADAGGLIMPKLESSLLRAVTQAVCESWSEVSSFKTQEEAVCFIMECQPFSFTPTLDPGVRPFPKFDNSHEASEYVLNMKPMPLTFASTVVEFKRRLRIRFVDASEDGDGTKKLLPSRSKRTRNSAIIVSARAVSAHAQKPWKVEACGDFFESPGSLKSPREAGTKYFIAVAQDIAQTVQQDGFKVQKRSSIPCSATAEEALAAWSQNEQRVKKELEEKVKKLEDEQLQGAAENSQLKLFKSQLAKLERKGNSKATVLPVIIPPEIAVVPHRKQQAKDLPPSFDGFLIRSKELPPSCFRIKKAGPTGAVGVET